MTDPANVSAVDWATAQVAAVRDAPAGRLALIDATYRAPDGRARRWLPYRRAALSFMHWQERRGILNPLDHALPGSPWWREVNARLLHDGCEAVALTEGRCGEPSSPSVALWLSFVASPSANGWYRAHNASIVCAYLDHRTLAEHESAAERFFMNVVLLRVLYAHALVGNPALALGRFAAVGRVLGDPRLGMAGVFLSLARVLPNHYPLGSHDVGVYLKDENRAGRILDYGVIAPRLQELYEWSADDLDEPRLLKLIEQGRPSYAWPADQHDIWGTSRAGWPARALGSALRARITPVGRHAT